MRLPCRMVLMVIGTTNRTLSFGNTSLTFICYTFDKGLHPGYFDFIDDLVFFQNDFFKKLWIKAVQLLRIWFLPKGIFEKLHQLIYRNSHLCRNLLLKICYFKNLFALVFDGIFNSGWTDFPDRATAFCPLSILVAVIIIVPFFPLVVNTCLIEPPQCPQRNSLLSDTINSAAPLARSYRLLDFVISCALSKTSRSMITLWMLIAPVFSVQ